ncbi:MAG: histidinol-phosphatase HisJ family protein [Oscillospiraceae bacterium]|nr:histidinol-phosphatase HisJ family protein [Oscillospiraceae bacterium]
MKIDYHVHSSLSFDGEPSASIENIYAKAQKENMDEIAICDHYDVNWVICGENPEIDFEASRARVDAANEGRKDPLAPKLLLGIELGQPHQCHKKAEQTLRENDFDFVLCALHNARGEKDFYYMDYQNTSVEHLTALFEKYTEELCELANWGDFHALAHITYPVRYLLANDIHIPMEKYADLYQKLFKIMIARGIALELNTSGMRKKIKQPSPSYALLKLYKSVGGELITLGSDAHKMQDIFSGIAEAQEQLRELGFGYISAVKNKKLVQIKNG